MSADDPQTNRPIESFDSATQEKIREFCYEWALTARRIIGHVVEDDELSLPEDLGSSEQVKPTEPQKK